MNSLLLMVAEAGPASILVAFAVTFFVGMLLAMSFAFTGSDPRKLSCTNADMTLYVDSALGLDTNDGALRSSGTGGSFSVAAGVVTFTGTGAAWAATEVGSCITIEWASAPRNNITAVIASRPAADQVTFANAAGVTGADATVKWAVHRPKRTLAAAMALFTRKVIRHKITLTVIGDHPVASVLDPVGYSHLLYVEPGGNVLIRGESATVVVEDDAGAPWAAGIHSAQGLGVVGIGWTTDEWRGYWIEVLDGACAGQTRTIHSNTATTLRPTKDWTGDPGACHFQIVRPKTRFIGNASYDGLSIYVNGVASSSYVRFCGLCFDGGDLLGATGVGLVVYGQTGYVGTWISFSGLVMENNGSWLGCYGCDADFQGELYDETQTAATGPSVGYGETAVNAYGLSLNNCLIWNMYGVVSCYVGLYMGSYFATITAPLSHGARIRTLKIEDCPGNPLSKVTIGNTAGYATTKLGGDVAYGEPGLSLLGGSKARVGGGVDISDSTTHGVLVENGSILHLDGVVTGTGNVGAGVRARDSAEVLTTSGSTPTLTGAVGDMAISSATVPEATWAQIEAGLVVNCREQGVLVKKAGQPGVLIEESLVHNAPTTLLVADDVSHDVITLDPAPARYTFVLRNASVADGGAISNYVEGWIKCAAAAGAVTAEGGQPVQVGVPIPISTTAAKNHLYFIRNPNTAFACRVFVTRVDS